MNTGWKPPKWVDSALNDDGSFFLQEKKRVTGKDIPKQSKKKKKIKKQGIKSPSNMEPHVSIESVQYNPRELHEQSQKEISNEARTEIHKIEPDDHLYKSSLDVPCSASSIPTTSLNEKQPTQETTYIEPLHDADEPTPSQLTEPIIQHRDIDVIEEKHPSLAADTYYKVIETVIKCIQENKNETHVLLATVISIQGSDHDNMKNDNDSYSIEHGQFKFRLDFDYDKWMDDKANYNTKFINEVSDVLKIEPDDILVCDYRRGSIWLRIEMALSCFWKDYIKRNVDRVPVYTEYIRDMRVQDQISVKYDDKWWDCTIVNVWDREGNGNKQFQVRYNPISNSGWGPFTWKNTEWFDSKREASRLRFDGQHYDFRNFQGEAIRKRWRAHPLAERDNVYRTQIDDHIFFKFGQFWHRCFVYDKQIKYTQSYTGSGGIRTQSYSACGRFTLTNYVECKLWVKDLINGNTKALNLWQDDHRNRIRFEDMRG